MPDLTRRKLKTFIIGSNLRMLQTEEDDSRLLYKIVPSGTLNNEEYELKANENDYYYLMRDQKSLSVDANFSQDFLDYMSKMARSSGVISTQSLVEYKPYVDGVFYTGIYDFQVYNEVYYNRDKIVIRPDSDVVQYNGRCYFMDFNSYVDKGDPSTGWRPYQIEQEVGTPANRKLLDDMVASYLSSTYDISYFDASHYVENKSVPVYDLGEDALKKISYVTLGSTKSTPQAAVDEFLAEAKLTGDFVSGILFDSGTGKISTTSYDTVAICNLLNENIQDKVDWNLVFDSLFSHMQFSSFLRLFDKKGELKHEEDKFYNDDPVNRYMYSFSLRTKDVMKDLPMNYFSLKTMFNPELMHDYSYKNVPNFVSVSTTSYKNQYNQICELLMMFRDIVETSFDKWVADNDILKHINEYVDDDDFLKSLVNDTIAPVLSRLDAEDILDVLKKLRDTEEGLLGNSYVNDMFMLHWRKTTGADLRFESNIGTYYEMKKNINDSRLKLKEEFDKFNKGKNIPALGESLDVDSGSVVNNVEARLLSMLTNLLLLIGGTMNFDNNEELGGIDLNVVKSAEIKRVREYIHSMSLSDKSFVEQLHEEGKYEFGVYRAPLERSGIDSMELMPYKDLFEHENSFTVDGIIYGKRDYEGCIKNVSDDLILIYKYHTPIDINFLKSIGKDAAWVTEYDLYTTNDIISLIQDLDCLYIFDLTTITKTIKQMIGGDYQVSATDGNALNALLNASLLPGERTVTLQDILNKQAQFHFTSGGETFNAQVRKLSTEEYVVIILNDSPSSTWKKNYFKMLDSMKKLEFIERFYGENYYQETMKHKSNVFSLEVKNSGLSTNPIPFNEFFERLKLPFTCKDYTHTDIPSLKSTTFGRIENWRFISFSNDLERLGYIVSDGSDPIKNGCMDDYSKLSFIPVIDRIKLKIRKTFEDSIRKSIYRYVPADTTLWKVEFTDL